MKFLPLKNAPTATSTPVTRRWSWKTLISSEKRLFVGLEHADYVFAVVFFADEEAALDVLRFAAGFDDVAAGILLNVLDGVVEG